jgi:hypothetical protein
MEAPLNGSVARIHAQQITTENMYRSTTEQWHSLQWARRLNLHPEMVQTVPEYKDRFTIWSHRYIQTRKISLDIENFTFSIPLKQERNG